MPFKHSFRFANPALNSELLVQLRTANVKHLLAGDNTIHYSAQDEERIESEFLGKIRDRIFSSWQLVFCPPDWTARYETYMRLHRVPFEGQWVDEQPCFIIPRQYRPHTWKLPASRHQKKPSMATAR